ncbi:MAG: hypothetical protein QXT14_02780 [Candidatus Bathyarchaeia archaeon]
MFEWLFEFVRPDDLVYAIENGEDMVSMFARCILDAFKDSLSSLEVEPLFEMLRRKRPDLASVIVSMPKGVEWLTKSIERLKG